MHNEMLKRLLKSCFVGDPSTERYTVKWTIGDGSFSTVILATDNVTGNEVILKKAKNLKEEQEIIAEYSILRRLQHPNIIRPIDFDSNGLGLGFMVLPRYTRDMYDQVMKKRPSHAEMKMFVKGMASAVNHFHSQDIVHRDIKPENILIKNDYSSAVLSDFGMAAHVSSRSTNLCGTLAYIAPEVQDAVDIKDFRTELDWKKCDVFSLGVTFYTVYEFAFLFHGRQDRQLATPDQEYIDEEIDSLSCDDDLKDLLKKMITVDPKERISISDVMKHPYLQ
jgi:serine/threonine protein kinase